MSPALEVGPMHRSLAMPLAARFRRLLAGSLLTVALLLPGARSTIAAPTARIQGRIVAVESGEPIGFADLLLVPADTTMAKVGGQTNADGSYLLTAAPGTYALQV